MKETKENIERKVYAVMRRMGFKDSYMGSTIIRELTCELLQTETAEWQYRTAFVSYAKSHGYEVKTMERNMSRAFEYAMTYVDYDYISSVLGDAGDSGRTHGVKELVIRLACSQRLGREADAERTLDSSVVDAVRVLMNYFSGRMEVMI